MTKAKLIEDLHDENQQWEALLAAIGEARMDQPIAPGQWPIKDIVAHLAGWRRRTVGRLRAAARGEPEPSTPWPAHLQTDEEISAWLHAASRDLPVSQQTDDEINAWLYAASRDLPVSEVLRNSRQVFADLVAAVEALPEEGLFAPDRFAWLDGQPLSAALLFGHFHEEHEADMRGWLARQGEAG
jgi:hypothetical protein